MAILTSMHGTKPPLTQMLVNVALNLLHSSTSASTLTMTTALVNCQHSWVCSPSPSPPCVPPYRLTLCQVTGVLTIAHASIGSSSVVMFWSSRLSVLPVVVVAISLTMFVSGSSSRCYDLCVCSAALVSFGRINNSVSGGLDVSVY
ncbi:hypothetical protein BDZ89DRAFT_358417 [Hymenopellis radicata]|nr:hypothetical protein BDZ89DRAFT_358417 [Hymenopellis radicata]